jgi:hypothetical protein
MKIYVRQYPDKIFTIEIPSEALVTGLAHKILEALGDSDFIFSSYLIDTRLTFGNTDLHCLSKLSEYGIKENDTIFATPYSLSKESTAFKRFVSQGEALLAPKQMDSKVEASQVPSSAKDWPEQGEWLQAMYEAITELKLWDQLKSQGRISLFIKGKNFIDAIGDHPKVVACGHSGATFAYCLNEMQFIAENGFTTYIQDRGRAMADDLRTTLEPK